jgi:hypothetical protein
MVGGWVGVGRVVVATPSSLPAASSLEVHPAACWFGRSPPGRRRATSNGGAAEGEGGGGQTGETARRGPSELSSAGGVIAAAVDVRPSESLGRPEERKKGGIFIGCLVQGDRFLDKTPVHRSVVRAVGTGQAQLQLVW